MQQPQPNLHQELAEKYQREIDELRDRARVIQKNLQQMAAHLGISLDDVFEDDHAQQEKTSP